MEEKLELKPSRACGAEVEESCCRHKFGAGQNNRPFLRKMNTSPKVVKYGQKFDF